MNNYLEKFEMRLFGENDQSATALALRGGETGALVENEIQIYPNFLNLFFQLN